MYKLISLLKKLQFSIKRIEIIKFSNSAKFGFEFQVKRVTSEGGLGEQTYCRKWVFDKMPKIVLGHNGEKIFPKLRLGIKCRIFFFLILLSFYLQNICLNIK
jgi:hypothetical protein